MKQFFLFFLLAAMQTTVVFSQKNFTKTLTDIGVSRGSNTAMVVQPDNKTVTGGFVINGQAYKFSFLRYNSDGTLDPSFGENGLDTLSNRILPSFYRSATISTMGLQSDGKIIAAGALYYSLSSSEDLFMMRLLPDGKIDTTFGTNGLSIYNRNYIDRINSIAIQPDNKIVAAGFVYDGAKYQFLVTRYLTNGITDSSFTTSSLQLNGRDDKAFDVAIQPDGKIVATGQTYTPDYGYKTATLRFLKNGTTDSSFGNKGTVISLIKGTNNIANSIALQEDEKIIIGGSLQMPDTSTNLLIIRYNANGSLDSSFATNGAYVKDVQGDNDLVKDLVLQSDQKILAGGNTVSQNVYSAVTCRLLPSGKEDNTYGAAGFTLTSVAGQGDNINAIVLKQNSKIQVCGYSSSGGNNYLSLIQFNSNGVKDNSFAGNGISLTGIGNSNDVAKRMVRLPWNNTLLVSGTAGTYWALVNYKLNLQTNNGFGVNGRFTYLFNESGNTPPEISIDSALQKIYLAGITDQYGFTIARLNKNGVVDSSFGTNGFVTYNLYQYYGALAVTADHKIWAGGTQLSGVRAINIMMRYNVDGTPDTTFGKESHIIFNLPVYVESLLPDATANRMLVGGNRNISSFKNGIAVMAVTGNGTLDSTFGTNGYTVKAVPGGATDVSFNQRIAQDALGRIYVHGAIRKNSGVYQFSITRFSGNGLADETFGDKGIVTTDVSDMSHPFAYNEAIAFCCTKKACSIITAGTKQDDYGNSRFVAVRYDDNGRIDSVPFTSAGYIDTLFYKDKYEGAFSVMVYDNNVYFAGRGGTENAGDIMMIRIALPSGKKENAVNIASAYQLRANPNPAHHFIVATFMLEESTTVQFRLVSATTGEVVGLDKLTVPKGTNQIRLNFSGAVQKGFYQLQLLTQKGYDSVKIWVN